MLAAYLDHCVARGALRPIDTFVAARALLGSLLTFVLSQEVLGGDELRPIPDESDRRDGERAVPARRARAGSADASACCAARVSRR